MCCSAVLCQICPLGIMLEMQAHRIGCQSLETLGAYFHYVLYCKFLCYLRLAA